MKKIILTIFIFVILIFNNLAYCSKTVCLDANNLFDIASKAFVDKDYNFAINEYKRFIYMFPDNPKVDLAKYKIAESYFNLSIFNESIKIFSKLSDNSPNKKIADNSYLMTSRAYLKINKPKEAILTLKNLAKITNDKMTINTAYYEIAWIYIETGNWEEAKFYLSKIENNQDEQQTLYTNSIEIAEKLQKADLIKQKNHRIAAALSIFPGGGFLYNERYYDAFISFLLNTTLFYASYLSFDNNNAPLGVAVAFVGFGFYAGSFYGAISSTHKYNRSQKYKFIQKLKRNKQSFKIGFDTVKKSPVLLFSYEF